jgi:hypothetical protein
MNGSKVLYYDFNLEMEQIAISLEFSANLLADNLQLRITQMMASGMSPNAILDVLRRDLANGGPLFGGLKKAVETNIFPAVDNIAQGAVIEANPGASRWEWITTSAGPCADCLPRHGVVKTYAEWEAIGLPRSGFSRCGDYCKCVLAPTNQVDPTLRSAPVQIPTLAQAREAYDAREK